MSQAQAAEVATPVTGRARPVRMLVPRPKLPGGRAVVGGLLVSVAAVGSLALSGSSEGADTVPVVVASHALDPGTPLGPDVLEVVQMARPEALLQATYDDPSSLRGSVSRSSVEPGELLQRGDVVQSTAAQRAAAPAREIALRLDPDRVVAGRLEDGDTVDVLATYGTGLDAYTVIVLHDASVLAVDRDDDGIGSSRGIVVTLALHERSDTIALAHAIDVATLNVVRTTTAASDDSVERAYRPDGASVGDGS